MTDPFVRDFNTQPRGLDAADLRFWPQVVLIFSAGVNRCVET